MTKLLPLSLPLALILIAHPLVSAQQDRLVPAPDRRAGEGRGPFPTLTIRNVMVIDGTGAPPAGPMNVVIEENRIARISSAGTPGVPPRPGAPAPSGEVLDATGMYLMPGFVNLHAHLGDAQKAPEAEYVYKLYMAHGVTTIRGVQLAAQPFALKEKARSAANAIVAPRIYNYQRPGAGWSEGAVDTPQKARAWVRWCAANGVDGMKLVAYPPRIMAALLDEAKKAGLGSTAHLEQRGVAQKTARGEEVALFLRIGPPPIPQPPGPTAGH
jgi:imidazolonepropionase-like amidohydrolase